jgi:hypothetical protein
MDYRTITVKEKGSRRFYGAITRSSLITHDNPVEIQLAMILSKLQRVARVRGKGIYHVTLNTIQSAIRRNKVIKSPTS